MSQPMCAYCGAPCTPQQADESAQAWRVACYAKAWAETAGNGPHRNQQELALYEAVEALEAAEKADA